LSAIHDAGVALAGLLDAIDDDKLRQVIRLVEASGQRRTLEPALATLRPRLRQLRPQRPLTLRRLLTIPLAPALDDPSDEYGSFSIPRVRLAHWQAIVLERLAPAVTEATRSAIAGRAADDEFAILDAGRHFWPEAAAALANETMPEETEIIAAERQRIADLLLLANQLVPLLGRLPLPLEPSDSADRTTMVAILDLAQVGPPERLGVIASLLLRRMRQPAAAVQRLLDLAPLTLRPRLEVILQRLLAEHRGSLAKRVACLRADPDLPLERAVDDLAALADMLAGAAAPARGRSWGRHGPDSELAHLREAAASIARERYGATLPAILAPLPPSGAANRSVAVKAREQIARRLARLGIAARRLAPDVSLHQLTEAAIERLVDLEARRRGDGRALVTIDDARLIEILSGPDLAWHYLRPASAR
jgi:hypothetical protein